MRAVQIESISIRDARRENGSEATGLARGRSIELRG